MNISDFEKLKKYVYEFNKRFLYLIEKPRYKSWNLLVLIINAKSKNS